MNPLLASIVSIIFVLCGFLAALIMLNLQGNPTDKPSNQTWRKFHKILGYLFLLIFLTMIIFMLNKVKGFGSELSARATLHMSLAFILFPLLMVKILIAHSFKRLYAHLFPLGLIILVISFTTVSISAGFFLIHSQVSISEKQRNNPETNTSGAINLLNKKCTLCHNLERVKTAGKSKEEWNKTIAKMVNYTRNPDHLSGQELTTMVNYLVSQKKK